MPNILLTQKCVRSCPYCFARKHMSESAPDDIISWENLIYIADFLEASNERTASLLGGEPTLHPEFNNIVGYLLRRDFRIKVFTSGIMSDETLADAIKLFHDVPPDHLTFVVNLNDPERIRTPLAETGALKRFLRAFGGKIVPGINIYRADFRLEYLFELINQYGLQRAIRVGIAHPIVAKNNLHIRLEQIDQVVAQFYSYASLMDRLRIQPGLDCGFPMCRFNDEQLGWLARHVGQHYSFGCGPVIDIGPDMTVWSCFPLSSFHQRSLFEFDSLGGIHDYFLDLHRKVRTEVGGIYPECDHCNYREDGICSGGCIAHNLKRFQGEAPLRMKEMYL